MLMNYIGSFILIILGLYIMITKKNLLKIIIGMIFIGNGVSLLFISVGFKVSGCDGTMASSLKEGLVGVDPILQAFTLTLILIGACTTIIALILVIKIKENYGTIDVDKIRRLKE